MTVIAWHRHKGIAIDSQCTRASMSIPTEKWRRFEDWLLIGTGDAGMVEKVMDAVTSRVPISFEIKKATVYAFQFAKEPGGEMRVCIVDGGLFPDYFKFAPNLLFDAAGHGSPYAVAALNLGVSPKDAVAAACKFSAACSGKIHVFTETGEQSEC